MSVTKRSIFRERAIQYYVQSSDKDVLPRFVAPPVFAFLWILLGFGLLSGFLIWSTLIPIYASVSGVIIQNGQSEELQALLFAPPEQASLIRPGQSVRLQIGSIGPHLQLTVTSMLSQVLSPIQIREQYSLDSTLGLAVNQPSAVAIVALNENATFQKYVGSLVNAEVQIGSRSVLSLFP